MTSPIWGHTGENKRVSNYSLGVRVRGVQFLGDESTEGQDTEKNQEKEGETWRAVYERNQ